MKGVCKIVGVVNHKAKPLIFIRPQQKVRLILGIDIIAWLHLIRQPLADTFPIQGKAWFGQRLSLVRVPYTVGEGFPLPQRTT